MGKPFSVNISRFDPYKTFRFQVYFEGQSKPVAGVSKVGAIKRSADVIEYKQGGSAIIQKGLGRHKYDPITLERGVTHDDDFHAWANAAQVLDKGVPRSSLKHLRKEMRIELLSEQGLIVHRYLIHRCWVSEFQALPELDAGSSAVAIEHIKIEHEGWEHDPSCTEPQEF